MASEKRDALAAALERAERVAAAIADALRGAAADAAGTDAAAELAARARAWAETLAWVRDERASLDSLRAARRECARLVRRARALGRPSAARDAATVMGMLDARFAALNRVLERFPTAAPPRRPEPGQPGAEAAPDAVLRPRTTDLVTGWIQTVGVPDTPAARAALDQIGAAAILAMAGTGLVGLFARWPTQGWIDELRGCVAACEAARVSLDALRLVAIMEFADTSVPDPAQARWWEILEVLSGHGSDAPDEELLAQALAMLLELRYGPAAPGTEINEDAIALEFPVSDAVIRAALEIMAGDGVVFLQSERNRSRTNRSDSEPVEERAQEVAVTIPQILAESPARYRPGAAIGNPEGFIQRFGAAVVRSAGRILEAMGVIEPGTAAGQWRVAGTHEITPQVLANAWRRDLLDASVEHLVLTAPPGVNPAVLEGTIEILTAEGWLDPASTRDAELRTRFELVALWALTVPGQLDPRVEELVDRLLTAMAWAISATDDQWRAHLAEVLRAWADGGVLLTHLRALIVHQLASDASSAFQQRWREILEVFDAGGHGPTAPTGAPSPAGSGGSQPTGARAGSTSGGGSPSGAGGGADQRGPAAAEDPQVHGAPGEPAQPDATAPRDAPRSEPGHPQPREVPAMPAEPGGPSDATAAVAAAPASVAPVPAAPAVSAPAPAEVSASDAPAPGVEAPAGTAPAPGVEAPAGTAPAGAPAPTPAAAPAAPDRAVPAGAPVSDSSVPASRPATVTGPQASLPAPASAPPAHLPPAQAPAPADARVPLAPAQAPAPAAPTSRAQPPSVQAPASASSAPAPAARATSVSAAPAATAPAAPPTPRGSGPAAEARPTWPAAGWAGAATSAAGSPRAGDAPAVSAPASEVPQPARARGVTGPAGTWPTGWSADQRSAPTVPAAGEPRPAGPDQGWPHIAADPAALRARASDAPAADAPAADAPAPDVPAPSAPASAVTGPAPDTAAPPPSPGSSPHP
jgi:hypothetical protein